MCVDAFMGNPKACFRDAYEHIDLVLFRSAQDNVWSGVGYV